MRARQGFTARLCNEEFQGVNIEFIVEGQTSRDAALIQEENNALRNQISELNAELDASARGIVEEAGRIAKEIKYQALLIKDQALLIKDLENQGEI